MRSNQLQRLSVLLGLVFLAGLLWRTGQVGAGLQDCLAAALFGLLAVFAMTFSIPLGPGWVSLTPMTAVAGCLVVGPELAGWAVAVAALVSSWIRRYHADWLRLPKQSALMGWVGIGIANATMQGAGILIAGILYRALGQRAPLTDVDLTLVLPLVVLALTYFVVNHVVAAVFIGLSGQERLQVYLGSLPQLLLFELPWIAFSPLLAAVYLQLGRGQFLVLAAGLVVASLAARNLALAGQRLARQVRELGSLQAVGRALSTSLDLEQILPAVHQQTAAVMPAHRFYIALYDHETDEVSFPLAIEDDRPVRWRSRRAGNGLTEHLLRSGESVLIRQNLASELEALGVALIGRSAGSFLGVPLVAGDRVIGAMAVQSTQPEMYDQGHRELLETIAAQAALAIQNARLYARTDEALARRVQELGSILETTEDGILLLDPGWRVLAANRALVDFVGLAQADFAGQLLDAPPPDGGAPLIELVGYATAEFEQACRSMIDSDVPGIKQEIALPGSPERCVERTLTPVRAPGGAIAGWLVVLRDQTEERELERLREDLTNMLVHNLRSPLTVVSGSLEMIAYASEKGDTQASDRMIDLAQRGVTQLMAMVDGLLDVSQLESGQMPIRRGPVVVGQLLESVVSQLAPLAEEAAIRVDIDCESDPPLLYADPGLIGRSLSNLLDNAIKFTPDGGHIVLWAKREPGAAEASVLLGVQDNGPGIPVHERARLFTKFSKASSVQGRRRGSGLGLAFCRLAVEAHGGEIWVDSEPGIGSTFVMRLPIGSPAGDAPSAGTATSDP